MDWATRSCHQSFGAIGDGDARRGSLRPGRKRWARGCQRNAKRRLCWGFSAVLTTIEVPRGNLHAIQRHIYPKTSSPVLRSFSQCQGRGSSTCVPVPSANTCSHAVPDTSDSYVLSLTAMQTLDSQAETLSACTCVSAAASVKSKAKLIRTKAME